MSLLFEEVKHALLSVERRGVYRPISLSLAGISIFEPVYSFALEFARQIDFVAAVGLQIGEALIGDSEHLVVRPRTRIGPRP